jgi:hypothetical protein
MLKFKVSKKGYTSAIFQIVGDEIKFQSKDITGDQFDPYPKSFEDLMKHLATLKKENFKIEVI